MRENCSTSDTFIVPNLFTEQFDDLVGAAEARQGVSERAQRRAEAISDRELYHELTKIAKEIEACRASL